MKIEQRLKPGGALRSVSRYRDNPKTLRVMLYGTMLSIEQSGSGSSEIYGEFQEGIAVTLYEKETLALLDAIKEQGMSGMEWEATIIHKGWLNPFAAADLRERAERAERRLTELLAQGAPTGNAAPRVVDLPKPADPKPMLLPKMPLPAHLRRDS